MRFKCANRISVFLRCPQLKGGLRDGYLTLQNSVELEKTLSQSLLKDFQ